jgi:hypothetical protein
MSAKESCRGSTASPRERPCGLQQARPKKGLHKPFDAHNLPPCAPDARQGATGFNFYLAGFWVSFGPILPWYSSISPLWNRNVYLLPLLLEACNFLLKIFTGAHS